MIPHALVLKPGLVVYSIYNGYWFGPYLVGAGLNDGEAGPAAVLVDHVGAVPAVQVVGTIATWAVDGSAPSARP
jgi:hypothetical protein